MTSLGTTARCIIEIKRADGRREIVDSHSNPRLDLLRALLEAFDIEWWSCIYKDVKITEFEFLKQFKLEWRQRYLVIGGTPWQNL